MTEIKIIELLKSGKSYEEIINENNITLVILEIEATGYYSGAEYEEHLVMTVDDFKAFVLDNGLEFYEHRDDDDHNPDELYGFEVSIPELDGKHSETYVDATMYMYTDEDIVDDEKIKDYFESGNSNLLDWVFSNASYGERKANAGVILDNAKQYIQKFDGELKTKVRITIPNKRRELVEQFKELIGQLDDNQTIKMEIISK